VVGTSLQALGLLLELFTHC